MDNITHGLAGLLVAQIAVRLFAGRRPSNATLVRSPLASGGRAGDSGANVLGGAGLRAAPSALATWAAWISALSNNLPDLDVLYAPITGGKLAYLLHHRGHTHTLPMALLAGIVVALGAAAWARLRRRVFSPSEWRLLVGLALIGPFLHISFDFGNDYGVHPFWPVDSRWFYGGALFIVEPWLWVFSVPALFLATRRRVPRVLLVLTLLVGLGLALSVSFVNLGARIALCVGALAFAAFAVRNRAEPTRSLWLGAGSTLLLLITFFVSSALAKPRLLSAAARAGFTRQEILAAVLTPSPGNPICFSAILVTQQGPEYGLRTAKVSILPSLLRASECQIEPRGGTLVLTELDVTKPISSDESVEFQQHWGAPADELKSLYHDHCQAQAFLRFARAPFWFPHGSDSWVLGDLRYDRLATIEFAEVVVQRKPAECPSWVPPWTPPLHSLFE